MSVEEDFSARSGSVNVGCEETGSATVQYNAPSGARIVSVNARWVDQSNIKVSDARVTSNDGSAATAAGTIRGLDYQRPFGIADCPGGGHATLEIFGRIAR
jgi:hypothetical protein